MTGHWQGYATQQSPRHAGCYHSFAFEKRGSNGAAAKNSALGDAG